MLKYHLEVRVRPPGDVLISVPGPFRGRSLGGFFVVPPTWPACFVAMLSPHGGDVEGLCCPLHWPMDCT
jgi:hypothetical protein